MAPLVFALLIAATPAKDLDRASAALADFRPADAVKILEKVKGKAPLSHAQHVRLYEQLGIAYAYLERSEDAVAAFETMLALAPARAISYTLSPKVTFLFEEARKRSARQIPPTVDLSWPRDLFVDQPVFVDVEVVADPVGFLAGAKLYYRKKGEAGFDSRKVSLPKKGDRPVRVEIPAPAPDSKASETLELYLIAHDKSRHEVLVFGSADRPRELRLGYEAPVPIWGKWWFWVAAGTVVAVSAGAAVFALTNEPSDTVSGGFEVVR